MSHLGKTTTASTTTHDWSAYSASNPCAVADGTLPLIAANGDKVFGDIDQTRSTVCEAGPGATPARWW